MTITTIIAALLLAGAPEPGTYVIDPAASAIKFHVDHALHKVDGEARGIEAKAQVGTDGRVRAMVRLQVAAMQTGDGNRDANMRAVLESDRYPYVVMKATSPLTLPAAYPATQPLKTSGELDLHGVKRQMEVPMQVAFDANGVARVTGSFSVSLEAHRIERPSLLFKKVDDQCRIEVDLLLRPEKK